MSDVDPMFDDSEPKDFPVSYHDKYTHAWKLFELRFDYAWNYFDFHAKQRMTMFNFFLIFSGFFVSACVLLLKEGPPLLLFMTSLLGATITLLFIFLDFRNRELLSVAEGLLLALEKSVLFKAFFDEPEKLSLLDWCGERRKRTKEGESYKQMKLGIFVRQEAEKDEVAKTEEKGEEASHFSHTRLLPGIQLLIVLVYAIFGSYAVIVMVRC